MRAKRRTIYQLSSVICSELLYFNCVTPKIIENKQLETLNFIRAATFSR